MAIRKLDGGGPLIPEDWFAEIPEDIEPEQETSSSLLRPERPTSTGVTVPQALHSTEGNSVVVLIFFMSTFEYEQI